MAVLDRTGATEDGPTEDGPAEGGRAERAEPKGAALRRGAPLGLLLAGLATVVWSGSFVTARALAESVPPIQHAFWRWIVALVAVAPFAARAAWRQRALLRRHIRYLLLASLLGVTVYNTLVNQAGISTTAGNMGMIMAASPVLMALYERLGGTRLGARRITGMLIACAGVVLLVSKGSLDLDFTTGDLWMLAAALSFASYSALLRPPGDGGDVTTGPEPAGIDGLAFLFSTFVLGALMLSPVYAASLAVQGGFPATTATVGPLLYVGVASSAVAFFAWNKAISLIGAARAGVVYYLQPVCVALLSFVVLGEPTGVFQVVCMALILGGVVLGAARSTGK